jgi:hypothetical protein
MELPKIDALALPELPDAAGLFGTGERRGPGSDDTLIVLMVFLYDLYEQ